jgi:hypothetical protein
MIEMRWYTRHEWREEDGALYQVIHQSLQYRVFRTHKITGDSADKLPDWSLNYGWSEWLDVPEVFEH